MDSSKRKNTAPSSGAKKVPKTTGMSATSSTASDLQGILASAESKLRKLIQTKTSAVEKMKAEQLNDVEKLKATFTVAEKSARDAVTTAKESLFRPCSNCQKNLNPLLLFSCPNNHTEAEDKDDMVADLNSLKAVELKALCKTHGLLLSGKKSVLIARLEKSRESGSSSSSIQDTTTELCARCRSLSWPACGN